MKRVRRACLYIRLAQRFHEEWLQFCARENVALARLSLVGTVVNVKLYLVPVLHSCLQ